jgi:hypothetical protein
LPLPELRPSSPAPPDVTIHYADVPDALPEPSANGIAWQSAPGRMLLSVQEVARYLVVHNREIRIQPSPGADEADVRIFLLGSVLGALLHARQILVLHASAIQTERGAVLFMGKSGAGKSTLLAAFLQRGYSMLADDKAGIVLEANTPAVVPGLPIIRLTPDAATKLAFPVQGFQLRHSLDKYLLVVPEFCAARVPLYASYGLEAHNGAGIRLERLDRLDRFQMLNRNTYRRGFLHEAEQRRAHFRMVSAASEQTRVVRVVRPGHPVLIDELASRIEEDIRA